MQVECFRESYCIFLRGNHKEFAIFFLFCFILYSTLIPTREQQPELQTRLRNISILKFVYRTFWPLDHLK